MTASAIPLPWLLMLWHGSIFWGSGYYASHAQCQEAKTAAIEMHLVTEGSCTKS